MRLFLVSDKLDPVIGMRLAGVEGACLRSSADMEKALCDAAANAEIGVILYTAGVREACAETVARLQRQTHPLLLEIPDGENETGSTSSITQYIQEAVGIRL